eukprot:UN30652
MFNHYYMDEYVEDYDYQRFERPQFPELRLNPQAEEFVPGDFGYHHLPRTYRDYPEFGYGLRDWELSELDRSYRDCLEYETHRPLRKHCHSQTRTPSRPKFKHSSANVNNYLSPGMGYGSNHSTQSKIGRGKSMFKGQMHRR